MQLVQNLYDHFVEKARQVRVSCLSIGLRYTAVTTDDGGMGIAYTHESESHFGSRQRAYKDYEGRSAVELLENIRKPETLNRSMGLALVNALNYNYACGLPEDADDRTWMDTLGIGKGTHLAMVGFFRPLMHKFSDRGAEVAVLDDGQGVGDRRDFYEKLNSWADALVLTSTSIINDSTEDIIGRLSSNVKVAMLGPSTPMVPEAFAHLPVHLLAGTLPVDHDAVLKAIRHGCGTPVIHRHSRKLYTLAGA